MKGLKKILLHALPPPLEEAVREQLASVDGLTVAGAGDMPDLVVAGAEIAVPGCPVLMLPPARAVRMGDVLRQMAQMLAQPVLYLDDVALGGGVFRPQDKSFRRADGSDAALTEREVDILAYLLRHHETPVGRDELLRDVWQYQDGVDSHTLETHIYRLRQKIEETVDTPRLLVTVEGGYRLCLD